MLRERMLFVRDLLLYKTLLRRPRIFWATIYPTYACNYRCRHCYGQYGVNYGPQDLAEHQLSFEQMRFIVEKLHQYGCRYIAFLGGEPLLHKDIKRIIGMVRSFGIELTIVTNGSLVRNKINEIREVSTLCFSIDGEEGANDFLRGKGAFARSLDAMVTAKKNGINVRINATIYKGSIDKMDALFDYAKKNKIFLGFCPLMYQSYLDDSCKYLRPSNEEYRRFYNKVIELKKRSYPIMYGRESYTTMLNWPDFDRVIIWKDDSFDVTKINFPPCCLAGRYYIYIGANGDVFPCSQLVATGKISPKNIFKDGFENAWHNAMNIPCQACTNIGILDINSILSCKIRSLCSMASQSFSEFLYV